MHLHHLSAQGFVHLIHRGLKTHRTLLGKQVFAWNVGFDFHHLVLTGVALFYPQENLKVLDLVVVGQQLVQFRFDKIQEGRVGVKMNRMNLNLLYEGQNNQVVGVIILSTLGNYKNYLINPLLIV